MLIPAYDLAAAHCGLVRQLAPELDETHVGGGSRRTAVLHHPAQVQVFNADSVKSARQVCCELVQGIRANGGDTAMQPRQVTAPPPAGSSLVRDELAYTFPASQRLRCGTQKLGSFADA